MKIGLISDVHGNLHALEAVLKALAGLQADLVVCAGDLVCYGAFPAECIRLLRERQIPSVMGNYDQAVALGLPRASRFPSTPLTEPVKQAALEWTQQALSRSCKQQLLRLPWRMDFVWDDCRIAVVHADGVSLDTYLMPGNSTELPDLVAAVASEVVVVGHTHLPFVEQVAGSLVINPGAVGRSLDGDPRASFALLDTEGLQVSHHRIDYDVERAAQAVVAAGQPELLGQLLRRGLRRVEQLEVVV